MGIMTAITTTTRSLLPRRPIRREQLPLRPPVDRRAFLNKCLSASWRFLRCAGIFRSSRCVRRFSPADYYPSAGADVMRSNAVPLFVRVAKVFGGLPVLPDERIIKTSILGDL